MEYASKIAIGMLRSVDNIILFGAMKMKILLSRTILRYQCQCILLYFLFCCFLRWIALFELQATELTSELVWSDRRVRSDFNGLPVRRYVDTSTDCLSVDTPSAFVRRGRSQTIVPSSSASSIIVHLAFTIHHTDGCFNKLFIALKESNILYSGQSQDSR